MKVLSQSYSPLCCSKPVWLFLFCGIDKEKFLQVTFFCVIIISEDWNFIGCKNIIKAIYMTNVLYFKHSNQFETLWEFFGWATLLTASGSQAFEWNSGWHRCFFYMQFQYNLYVMLYDSCISLTSNSKCCSIVKRGQSASWDYRDSEALMMH